MPARIRPPKRTPALAGRDIAVRDIADTGDAFYQCSDAEFG